ncbi:hypothetical protein [Ralstonia solanacearum]|uniref:hypothetical protein n=1 Tax=Ralstonia solanacearum TaxID=305 RepID=UPI001F09D20D|nr:hypothetical protein [Ralstonia solanacearum]
MSPSDATAELQKQFRVDPDLIKAFNAYRDATANTSAATTPALIHHHYGYFLRWRHRWLGKVASMPSVQHSEKTDQVDLLTADAELAEELKWVKRYANYQNLVPNWAKGHYTGWVMEGAQWSAETGATTLGALMAGVAGVGGRPALQNAVPEAPGGSVAWIPAVGAVQGATLFYRAKQAIGIKFDSWGAVKQAWENPKCRTPWTPFSPAMRTIRAPGSNPWATTTTCGIASSSASWMRPPRRTPRSGTRRP